VTCHPSMQLLVLFTCVSERQLELLASPMSKQKCVLSVHVMHPVSTIGVHLLCPFYKACLWWFRLAKSICAQIKDRVRRSHAIFETSLTRLEAHHNGRLQQTEKQRLSVRKEYAPRIARLALESRSLRDLILYGLLGLLF